MIQPINPDRAALFADRDLDRLLAMQPVRDFLATLDAEVPGLDLTLDGALAVGFLAVAETRAGRLDEHLAIGAKTFDGNEFADLVAAALTYLGPLVGLRFRASAGC